MFRLFKDNKEAKVEDTPPPKMPPLIVYMVYKRRLGSYVGQEGSYVLNGDIASTLTPREIRSMLSNNRGATVGDLIVAITGDSKDTKAWLMREWTEELQPIDDFASWIDLTEKCLYYEIYKPH